MFPKAHPTTDAERNK